MPVGIVCNRIGGPLVNRLPGDVQGVEGLLVEGERPPALARPPPGGRRVDLEQDGQRPPGQKLPRLRQEHGATAEGDHRRLVSVEHGRGDGRLGDPEAGLAVAREQLLDRGTGALLDLQVEVDERAPQPEGDLPAQRRLPRTHEAGEREVAAQGVRGHRMRST